MTEIAVRDQTFDDKTSACAGELEIGSAKICIPNKLATTSEMNASRIIGLTMSGIGGLLVLGKLIFPDSLKRLLTEDLSLKKFARGLSRETRGLDIQRLLFLCYRGDAAIENSEDLRTILDMQYFAGFDIITVQQSRNLSPDQYLSLFNFAKRWMDERGIDKPLMPILQAIEDHEVQEKVLVPLLKQDVPAIGVDLQGSFRYHTLRAVEDLKDKKPSMWVHVFQVPPKIRFGGGLLPCSCGMMMHYFGVDTFSRWVVPPPPEPLTKDRINFFDRNNWGVLKRKDWARLYGENLGCGCSVCSDRNLQSFFEGSVLTALARSKIHDHYAQQDELEKSAKQIREGSFAKFIRSKEYPRKFIEAIGQKD